jgi:hypothetical protein
MQATGHAGEHMYQLHRPDTNTPSAQEDSQVRAVGGAVVVQVHVRVVVGVAVAGAPRAHEYAKVGAVDGAAGVRVAVARHPRPAVGAVAHSLFRRARVVGQPHHVVSPIAQRVV